MLSINVILNNLEPKRHELYDALGLTFVNPRVNGKTRTFPMHRVLIHTKLTWISLSMVLQVQNVLLMSLLCLWCYEHFLKTSMDKNGFIHGLRRGLEAANNLMETTSTNARRLYS